ncbi:uncharacterized protein CELE_R07B1.5 [Caenorhabditis elegans]|uniref:Uncharacterized protein R07B1.5 n=1 Tax=Caenorhabditis elegans TaxID=6239 RepID=YRN5_CAEEL|nr:Uncharacterized protein CELE_R07B1.5 [Caenorhabditis elegans]Q09419.1 RecName: Full=Uncharacterized protein R07B1.5; Flags: Precursor [Caenorhabditis elegans]CAA88542.1 Uncharacterized protein CELE_R07B1.5 [Caenorhabditis elegans]|eukprot:NP_509653.1 Uncharacterized protein CELE_R07B1.5 [Caenorhabditis elegans]
MELLSLAILSSFFAVANQCAATSPVTSPTTTTTEASVTTTIATSTSTTTVTTTTTVVTAACATCTTAQIGIITGNDGDMTPTSAITTDASGCSVITYTCERTPNVETDIVLITFYSDSQTPTDVGTENGVGTANVVMNCVNGEWVKDGIVINDVECQIIT